MSRRSTKGSAPQKIHATIFAALGDTTRLLLVARLAEGAPQSISGLTEGTQLTRQAVTKHLRVLENAGIVESTRSGRETQFRFNAGPIDKASSYLEMVSNQWDVTLGRLKLFVEKD